MSNSHHHKVQTLLVSVEIPCGVTMQQMSDSKSQGRTPAREADLPWVEVTHPLADAMHALAQCIEHAPQGLSGACIAITRGGTLLLNRRAWELCRSALEGLPALQTTETRLENADTVRFLLAPTNDLPD